MSAFWFLIIAANCCTVVALGLSGLRAHMAAMLLAGTAVGLCVASLALAVAGAA